ncbi:MAG: hypothetical protein JNM84_13765 [Planctomycetes bacterium]|nr:hypothetical protein [Planctomycetota bacterium]
MSLESRVARLAAFASFALVALGSSAAAQSTPYGLGTAGTGAITPTIASGDPAIGNTAFAIEVAGALGGAPALLLFSLAPGNLPLPGGTTVLVDLIPPSFLFTAPFSLGGAGGVPGAGSGSYALPLPANLPRELIGAAVYAQALIGDVTPTGGLAATSGLEVRLRHEPLVFVGTSVGGSTDPHWVIDARTNTLRSNANSTFTDNVTDARFAPGGRYLYVSSSLGNAVQRGDLGTANVSWSTFYAAGGPCYGLAIDAPRQRLYTMTGATSSSFELVAVDADPTSVSYGQPLGSTNGLAGGALIERWALAPSGDFAIVPTLLSDVVQRVDTNPASATYLQVTGTYFLPPATSALRIANQVRILPGDRYALILIQNAGSTPGEMHRLDVQTGLFVDHDPATVAIDALGIRSQPPVGFGSAPHGFALARDGSFAVVTGWSGSGFAGRLDLDPQNPLVFAWTSYVPGVSLGGAWACDLARDEQSVFVGTFPTNPQLHRLDVQTGTLIASVPLAGASNVYTVRAN